MKFFLIIQFAGEPGEDVAVKRLADTGTGKDEVVQTAVDTHCRDVRSQAGAIATYVGRIKHGRRRR